MGLVITFGPYDDESGGGYYRRLASENALLGWQELAQLAGIACSRSALFGRPDLVATQLGLESAWADFASQKESECRSWRGLRRASTEAICPACLREQLYIRHYWENAYAVACPLHRVRLIDRCPVCSELLTRNRACIELCTCGCDLRTAETFNSTASQHWLSSLIASNGFSSGGVTPRLKHVAVNALCELARTLCLYKNPLVPPPRRSTGSVRTLQEAFEFLAPLERLLDDWPRGFERHVAGRIAAASPSARTLNTLLGQWYVRLRRVCEGSPLQPFLNSVVEVAARDFDGALGLDSAKAIASAATEHIRATDAAKILGVSRDRLIAAAQRGDCLYRTRRLGTRGRVYEIPHAEVDRIAARRNEWISEQRAEELAGVSAAVMREMIAAKVVRSDTHWRSGLMKAGPVEKQSIQELFDCVSAHSYEREQSDGEYVLWAELTSRRMGDRQAIRSVMRAAASGEICPLLGGQCLGQIRFLRSEVAHYFGTPMLEAGMSVQSLSQATGWKWESIAHWISLGLIASQQIVLRRQSCRVILPQQLLEFQRTYLPLADLAKAMGTTSSALAEQLSGVEIVGGKELPNGVRRGGLIRVADLGRMAVSAGPFVRNRPD